MERPKQKPEGEDENKLFTDYSDSPISLRRKLREAKPIDLQQAKRSDILFYCVIGILIVLFASFFAVGYYKSHKRPLTLEELHEKNFDGKLASDEGYIYNGLYSFIKFDGFWYTALQSKTGSTLYNFAFRYSPNELESVKVGGNLDTVLFNSASQYYITFNPTEENLAHTVLAVNDFNQHMINAFQKMPIAACDRNETISCETRPIITCESTDEIVVYIRQAESASVEYDNNCIVVSGNEFDQVKGVDRVLYTFYNIMG